MTVISTPPKSFDTIGVFSSFVAGKDALLLTLCRGDRIRRGSLSSTQSIICRSSSDVICPGARRAAGRATIVAAAARAEAKTAEGGLVRWSNKQRAGGWKWKRASNEQLQMP